MSRWNPSIDSNSTLVFPANNILEGNSKALKQVCKFVNVYGPYKDTKPYWDMLSIQNLMSRDNFIVGRDLNLTLSARKV
jgi:hypothetical protein